MTKKPAVSLWLNLNEDRPISVEKIYKEKVSDTPQIVFDTFAEVRKRLKQSQDKYGDYICPFDLTARR